MATSARRRMHAHVSGLVQGVYFRASTQQQAAALGLSGWVRNLPDGRVEVLAEGPPEKVGALVDWLGRGPAGSRVDGIRLSEEAPEGSDAPFEVRR